METKRVGAMKVGAFVKYNGTSYIVTNLCFAIDRGCYVYDKDSLQDEYHTTLINDKGWACSFPPDMMVEVIKE